MTKAEINGGEPCEYEACEVPINEVKKMIFRGTWEDSLEKEEVLYNLQHNLYSEEYKSKIVRLFKLNDDAEKWVKDNLVTNTISFEEKQLRKLVYFAGAETTRIEFEEEIKKMSELINRYYMVCTEIPKELRTMTFDSCLEDTVKMVHDKIGGKDENQR